MVTWKTITIEKNGTLHQFKYTTDEYDEDIEKGLKWAEIWKKKLEKGKRLDEKPSVSKFKNMWQGITRENLKNIKKFNPTSFKSWINKIDKVDDMNDFKFGQFRDQLEDLNIAIYEQGQEEQEESYPFAGEGREIPYVSDGSDSAGFGISPPQTPPKTGPGGESKKQRRIVKPKKMAQRAEEREDALQAAAEGQAEGGIPFQGGSNIKKRRKKRKTKRKKRRRKKKRNRKSRKIRGGHNHGLHLGGGKFLLGGGI